MSETKPASSPPIRREASVLANRRVAEETWWLELDSPEIAVRSRPGQFVMIGFGLENAGIALLPRPFSVGWRADDGRVGLLVRVFGAGTRRLAELREEDRVLLLGPLGRPFRVEPGRPILCLAGGVGLAPFIFGASEWRRAGHDVHLLYGERRAASVFQVALLEKLARGSVEVWTEDGGAGCSGRVTDGLEKRPDRARATVLACGPAPMLRTVAKRAVAEGWSLQVAVEEYMGCGVGTCQGCVVPGADGRWRKACTDGPVFRAEELDWS